MSATTTVLGRLCAAYDLSMSRLMYLVEDGYSPLMKREMQSVWSDPRTGFRRRAVSPPARSLSGEVVQCELAAGTRIAYDRPTRRGLEHHLVLLDGALIVTVDAQRHDLEPGDCLRYQLFGPSAFDTPAASGARYILFVV